MLQLGPGALAETAIDWDSSSQYLPPNLQNRDQSARSSVSFHVSKSTSLQMFATGLWPASWNAKPSHCTVFVHICSPSKMLSILNILFPHGAKKTKQNSCLSESCNSLIHIRIRKLTRVVLASLSRENHFYRPCNPEPFGWIFYWDLLWHTNAHTRTSTHTQKKNPPKRYAIFWLYFKRAILTQQWSSTMKI